MKSLFILFILLSLVSCVQESVPSFDTLTPEEQDEIRRRSQEKCLDENKSEFEAFSANSTNHIMSLVRGDGWQLKQGGVTKEIRVWKVIPYTAVYFIVEESTQVKFIKIPTVFNTQMGMDFLKKKCDKVITASASSSSLQVKWTNKNTYVSSNYWDFDYTYTISNEFPIFLLKDKYKLAKKKLKSSGSSQVISTENEESTITKIDRANNEWINRGIGYYTNIQLCIVPYSGDAVTKSFQFPNQELICSPGNSSPANPGTDPSLTNFTTAEL